MPKRRKEILINLIKLALVLSTILSFVKGILISLDIDESYAVALGYRMAKGDMLIRDMWEPHQFSGFAAALFICPYIRICGTTDYLVIYLRIVGALIHAGLGAMLYRQLKKSLNRFTAFCIVILYLNFLPKWIQMPEFELMHYWCLLGIFLVLHAYFTGAKPKAFLPFAGGCLLACSMLCYPTMVLAYPFYILSICMLERLCFKTSGRGFWKSTCFFTLGASLSGAALLLFLSSYMSFHELMRYIPYLFMDKSHGIYTMQEKWAGYLEEFLAQAATYCSRLLPAAAILLILCLACPLIFPGVSGVSSKRCGRGTAKAPFSSGALPVATAVLILAGILLQAEALYGFLFDDKNQFYLQMRYIALLLPALIPAIRFHRKMAVWFYLCILPGIVSVAAVLFVTNMDTNVTYAKAFFGVLGSLVILELYGQELTGNPFWKSVFPVLKYVCGGMALAGLLVCRLLLIRVSGCLPVTIRAPLEKMESGPEKGVWVLSDTAEIWNDNYRELEKYISEKDRVLYIGAESLIYAKTETLPSTPSTQGTTVYNEMILHYYKEHPDRIPEVIIYDKTFGENQAYALSYRLSLQNPVLFQWIEENYATAEKIETEYMILLIKKS